MNTYRYRRLIVSLGLTVPMTTLVACGDPCLDDGFGHIGSNCAAVSDDGADESGGLDEPDPDPDPDPDQSDGSGGDLESTEFYLDADEDGYGTPNDSVIAEPGDPPMGYVPADAGVDCDDDNPRTHPGAAEFEGSDSCTNDDDEDGWGDANPGAGITAGTDCDDLSDTTYPGAAVNEDPGACTKDDDGDGWGDSEPPPGVDPGDDCADQDPVLFGCHTAWCTDADGDGYGDPMSCVPGGDIPPDGDRVSNDDDCNDDDSRVHPGAAVNEPRLCTLDGDGDGWGDAEAPEPAEAGSDCLDVNPSAFPGAASNEPFSCTIDDDGDGWGDASATLIDMRLDDGSDCLDSDATIYPGAAANEPSLCTTDADGDGFGPLVPPAGAEAGTDCDDTLVFAYPGAAENEAPPLDAECTLDADEDGYGDLGASEPIVLGTDCNDASANTYPGAAELESLSACMADEDLDGYGASDPPLGVDAGVDCADGDITVTVCDQWCFDADGDGFGTSANCDLAESDPGAQWVPNDIDCLDSDASAYPGAAANEPGLCTIDADADGFGTSSPPPMVSAGADCDDASVVTFPGASESEPAPLDGACTTDADEDGYGDDAPAAGVTAGSDCVDTEALISVGSASNEPSLCTIDMDGDGYGSSSTSVAYPGADDGSDCEDSLPLAFPGASQNEEGELLTACTLDADDDGYGDDTPPADVTSGTDCDDGIETTYPGAAELDDPSACMADADLDGYGDASPPPGVLSGVDCADDDDSITICNQWCLDSDGDSFGGATCQLSDGSPGADWVENSNDCLDSNPSVYPGAASSEPELCTIDGDGDGYGDATPPEGAAAGTDCDDSTALAMPGAAPLDDPAACMIDLDEDDYGDASAIAPVVAGTDCVDASADIHVGTAASEATLCTADADGDGYGDASASSMFVAADDGSDCNDASPTTHPGAAQLEPALCATDDDDDGYGDSTPLAGVDPGADCVDSSATVYPGAAWLEPSLCAQDSDGDGYASADPPAGAEIGLDCDDLSASTYPGAAPDDDPLACLKDSDGDGYGDDSPPTGITAGSDCDDTDPNFADCSCLAPLEYSTCDGIPGDPQGADAYQAMGLGCSADMTESMVIDSTNFAVTDAATWAILHQYGSAPENPLDPASPGIWTPRPEVANPESNHNAGNNMVLLSTGPITPPNANGVVLEAPSTQSSGGNVGNLDGGGFPAPLTDALGSNGGMGGTPFEDCDGVNDCSEALADLGLGGLGLNDQVFFQVELTVPEGVDGFRFDFAYFSSEYPAWVDTNFNDIFVVWVESAAFTGNVAVTQDGTPFTVTELANSGEMTIIDSDPLLAGTGFEGHGATGWRSVLAPVIPSETITVSFFLADVADTAFTTAALIDNFRWDCAGCDGVGECGLTSLP